MSTNGRKNGILGLLVAALLVFPVATMAQQGQHRHGQDQAARDEDRPGMMGMRGQGAMMGMMGMMAAPNPMMILRQRDALDLTDEQVRRLEGLRDRLAERRTQHMEAMRTTHERMAEQAGAAEVDLEAYESTLRAMADQSLATHLAMAEIGREARQVLTPEQREKLQVGMQFARGTMMSMMQGMGMQRMGERMGPDQGMGPMMQGMMMQGMPCPMIGADPEEGG